jgi:hypothetical protein
MKYRNSNTLCGMHQLGHFYVCPDCSLHRCADLEINILKFRALVQLPKCGSQGDKVADSEFP